MPCVWLQPQAEHVRQRYFSFGPSPHAMCLLQTRSPPFPIRLVHAPGEARGLCAFPYVLVAFVPSPLCLWIPQNQIPQNDPSATDASPPPKERAPESDPPESDLAERSRLVGIFCVFVPGLGSPRMIPAPPTPPPPESKLPEADPPESDSPEADPPESDSPECSPSRGPETPCIGSPSIVIPQYCNPPVLCDLV